MATRDVIFIMIQIGIIVLAGIGGYYTFIIRMERRMGAVEQRCEHHQETLGRVQEVSDEVQRLKTENIMFWKVIEPHLGQIIHSPDHKLRDRLVDKLISGTLSDDEANTLIVQLRNALCDNGWPNDKKMAAALLLARAVTLTNGTRSEDRCNI